MSTLYDINLNVRADLQYHIKRFFLYPGHWEDPANQMPFSLTWQSRKFSARNLRTIPKQPGVYAFTINPEYAGFFETKYLCYIGKTNRDLHTRFAEYVNEGLGKGKPRPKVFEMLKQYSGYLHFNFAVLPTAAQVDEAEDKLINTFVPHVNKVVQIAKIRPEYHYLYD